MKVAELEGDALDEAVMRGLLDHMIGAPLNGDTREKIYALVSDFLKESRHFIHRVIGRRVARSSIARRSSSSRMRMVSGAQRLSSIQKLMAEASTSVPRGRVKLRLWRPCVPTWPESSVTSCRVWM